MFFFIFFLNVESLPQVLVPPLTTFKVLFSVRNIINAKVVFLLKDTTPALMALSGFPDMVIIEEVDGNGATLVGGPF